jgi:hypothetical protein
MAKSQTHPAWEVSAILALITIFLMGFGGMVVVVSSTVLSSLRLPFVVSAGVLSILIGLVFLFSLSVVRTRTTYW